MAGQGGAVVMQDLSDRVPGLAVTGQHAGASTLRPDAMSAPGTASSASGADDPAVEMISHDRTVTRPEGARDPSPWARAAGTAWQDQEGAVPGNAPRAEWEQA